MLSRYWITTDTFYYQPTQGLPLFFEYVSKYRRVTVVGEGKGFELRVLYKGLPIKDWSKRYGCKADAIAWAKVQANNREITIGSLTIKEPIGKQII